MGTPLIDFDFPPIQIPNNTSTQSPALDTSGQSTLAPSSDTVATNAQATNAGNNVTVWRYPAELGTDVQYPHYVMFYINARAGTQIADKRGQRNANGQLVTANTSDQLRLDQANSVQEGTAVGAAAGATGGAVLLESFVKASAPVATKAIVGGAGAVAGGVLGGGVGATYAKLNQRPLIKIKDVIALHVNTPPAAAYKAQWNEADMGAVWGIGGAVHDLDYQTFLDAGDVIARQVFSKMPKAIGGPDVKSAAEAISRKVTNPFKEQLFKSMGMRTFTFEYTFLPKSLQEARSVLNILRIFKRNMHPEMDTGKLFLVYPSEFNIVYYYRDKENPYINKISSCVLTDMNVRFGDGKDFTTFVSGWPTQIEMKLTFLELEMLTAERVDADLDMTGTVYGY